MKIIKAQSKKVNDKQYYKYIVTLPTKVVEASRLLEKKLKATLEKDKRVIEKELVYN